MSIAVAVRSGRDIVLAADSKRTFGSSALTESNLSDEKIRQVGKTYLAATGWGIYANILDDYLARKPKARLDSKAAIFTFFCDLWKVLHARYSMVNDQCSEPDSPFGDLDATFLVINKSGIFSVGCDMSVTEFREYYAIGSGAPYSLGALHALYGKDESAEQVATRAVQAACALDIYCGGDVLVRKIRV
jgi:ATP-dependent HslUV protease, peptidase subunit HslV